MSLGKLANMVKQLYHFDVFVDVEGSESYASHVRFFARVKPDDPAQDTGEPSKGLLRVKL